MAREVWIGQLYSWLERLVKRPVILVTRVETWQCLGRSFQLYLKFLVVNVKNWVGLKDIHIGIWTPCDTISSVCCYGSICRWPKLSIGISIPGASIRKLLVCWKTARLVVGNYRSGTRGNVSWNELRSVKDSNEVGRDCVDDLCGEECDLKGLNSILLIPGSIGRPLRWRKLWALVRLNIRGDVDNSKSTSCNSLIADRKTLSNDISTRIKRSRYALSNPLRGTAVVAWTSLVRNLHKTCIVRRLKRLKRIKIASWVCGRKYLILRLAV